jgi:hypothetical protein
MTSRDDEVLFGGNVSGGVLRVGATVRRPVGPWTPAVHALLRHLESVGFDGAPRLLGLDDDGREVLEFIPGVVPWDERHRRYLGTDDAVRRVGRLLRAFHDAVATFRPPPTFRWREPDRENEASAFVDERGVIVCHNDPAAWNLVLGDRRWAFIDWDFAGPRPFIWDVAYAVVGILPIAPDASGLGWDEPVPFVPRLRTLTDGYGLEDRDKERLLDVVIARIGSVYDRLRLNADAGAEPWSTLWAEGHGAAWSEMLVYAADQRPYWQRQLDW